ncbi:MAG: hypothetical protein KGJ03_06395 [Betaproteobacteria bacterium]|nr:hypothetical protein [Betaproteobacteria bacterium]MDE2153007.1 hypothetical protein [Betaproteobacteria bacterium]
MRTTERSVCGVLLSLALSACAAPGGPSDAQPSAFYRGTTIAALQNAIVAREMPRGWAVEQQGNNMLKLEQPWNGDMNFARVMFNALNGARSSKEVATFQFAEMNGGVEVVGNDVIVSDLGFGNQQTTPMRQGNGAGSMQAMLDDLKIHVGKEQ